MKPSLRPVISYESSVESESRREQRSAMDRGTLAAFMAGGSLLIGYSNDCVALLAPLVNLLALVCGGIGWFRSRRSRPNTSYVFCSIINTVNWVLFFWWGFYFAHIGWS